MDTSFAVYMAFLILGVILVISSVGLGVYNKVTNKHSRKLSYWLLGVGVVLILIGYQIFKATFSVI